MAKLKHIAIATQDPEETANFYREVFGLKLVGKVDSDNAGWAGGSRGRWSMYLYYWWQRRYLWRFIYRCVFQMEARLGRPRP